jgi:hypothetical protein
MRRRQQHAIFALLVMTLVLAGCAIPLSRQTTNASLFVSPDDLSDRLQGLQSEMTQTEAFETLDLDRRLFRVLPANQIQRIVYGDFQVQGSPAELETFRDRLASYHGYELVYRSIKRSGGVGLLAVNIDNEGFDQQLILIFDEGLLFKAAIVGSAVVDDRKSIYIIEVLGTAVAAGASFFF